MVLTELLPKRVQYMPIGLLVRWLVVRAELHDVSEKRLVASFCRLPFVHATVRDALQKLQVATVGHRELDGTFPTRCFLGGARWFIGPQLVLPVL
jgi:hypothetical protein